MCIKYIEQEISKMLGIPPTYLGGTPNQRSNSIVTSEKFRGKLIKSLPKDQRKFVK